MIFTFSSCHFLPKAKDEYKDLLNLPVGYLSPIEAQWASVFLPPQLPIQSKTEGRFLNAWNMQATYILAKMQKINDQGHLFHEALLKTAEMLMSVSGTVGS